MFLVLLKIFKCWISKCHNEKCNKCTAVSTVAPVFEYAQTEQYLKGFGGSATGESYIEVDFVLLFQNLISSLSPSGGADIRVL